MNNRQVAHLWANMSRNSAHGSHFYFEGDTIYSYGLHFPIAKHCTDKKGRRYILMTTKGYSPSTARHVSYVRQAIASGARLFYVEDPLRDYSKADLRLEFKEKEKAVVKESLRLSRARSYVSTEYLERLVKTANEFAEFFGLKERVLPDSPEFAALVAKTDKRTKKEREAALVRQAARVKQQAEEAAERAKLQERRDKETRLYLEMWKGGSFDNICDAFNMLPVALRIKGGNMETSHGAEVPTSEAKKAVRFVSTIRNTGKGWRRGVEPFQVGDFQLDSVTATGDVVAGCHRIAWDEVERIGKAEGWI